MTDAQTNDTPALPAPTRCLNCGYNDPDKGASCPRCGISQEAAKERAKAAADAKASTPEESIIPAADTRTDEPSPEHETPPEHAADV